MKNDLMEEDISKNDFVLVKEVDDKELHEGDIIAYEINGQIRINKIIDKKDGYSIYSTKSNKNYYPDIKKININQIIGKEVVNIPVLGLLIEVLQTKLVGIFTSIFLCFSYYYNKYRYVKRNERNKIKEKIESIEKEK